MTGASRAALYCRISDKKDAAAKIATQVAQCRDYAARKGYVVSEDLIFTDESD